jgi:hypothetical protein
MRAPRQHMAQRVGARVSILGRIRHRTYASPIEHHEDEPIESHKQIRFY